jgi:hypothetical protein
VQFGVEADHQEPGADEPDAGYAQPVAAARTGAVSHLSAPQAHAPGPERRRRLNAITPARTPIPTRPIPAASNGPPIVVDVAPSPVPGAPEGVAGALDGVAGALDGVAGGLDGVAGALDGVAEALAVASTTSVAVPEFPFEQSMDGLYVPGVMFFGRPTVVAKPPASVDACIGICSGSPSVAPNKVADVAEEPQVTLNVTRAPGGAVDGVTSIGGTDAKAGAAVSTTAPASVNAAPAQQMRRNGLPSPIGQGFPCRFRPAITSRPTWAALIRVTYRIHTLTR